MNGEAKSNSALTTYAAARRDVREHGPLPVPARLRNAPTSMMRSMGYGKEYKYPHNFDGHYVPESYLPEQLEGQHYYVPSAEGREREIGERLDQWRQARRNPPSDESP